MNVVSTVVELRQSCHLCFLLFVGVYLPKLTSAGESLENYNYLGKWKSISQISVVRRGKENVANKILLGS